MIPFRSLKDVTAAHGEYFIPPNPQSQKGISFLEHLAGLRGIAILLIIFFHLIPQYVPNGFLGVDIFLVVTGYLLFLNLQRKGLNAGEFLTKRVMRIFPPLIATVLFTLLFAICLMHCSDVCAAAKTGISALLGYSNVELRKSLDGYFAEDSSYHPLVHTWYLSVTIQLYLIFMVGCFIFRKVPRKITIVILSLIALVTLYFTYRYEIEQFFRSFGIVLGNERRPESHFKTLPRLWEPLAGMLVCFLPTATSKARATITTMIGLVLLLGPALCPLAFLGRCALVIVIGTVLVLKYAPDSSIFRMLSNKIFLWIGGVSFSLYLVHIPVFVFFKEIIFFSPQLWHYAAMVFITLALGLLLYHLVETRRFKLKVILISWVGTLLLGAGLLGTNGLKNYIHVESNAVSIQNHENWKPHTLAKSAEGYDNAQLGHWRHLMYYIDRSVKVKKHPVLAPPFLQIGKSEVAPSFVLIGDSHANCIYMGLDNLFQKTDKSGIYVQMRILPFINLHFPPQTFTQTQAEALFSWLEAHPELETVFLINRYTSRLLSSNIPADWENKTVSLTPEILEKSMALFLTRLKAMGKNVVVFTPTPESAKGVPLRYVRWCLRYGKQMDIEKTSITKKEYMNYNKEILNILSCLEQAGLCTLIHIGENSFNASGILPTIQNSRPILWDDNHLTSAGATYVAEKSQTEIFQQVDATLIPQK